MNAIHSTLARVFARTFYEVHTPLFLFAGGICFGFMRGIEHQALARFFVSSPVLIAIPSAVWLIYTIKVVLFNRSILAADQNEFIFSITLLKAPIQIRALCITLIIQLMPIIIYALFLVMTAIQFHKILSIALISFSIIIIIAVSASIFFLHLNTHGDNTILNLLNIIKIRYPRPYVLVCIEWIVREDFVTFFITKIFSCLVLWGITKLYQTDNYDWRLLGIGLIIAFSANLNSPRQLQQFESSQFQIIRNLPLSLRKRFFTSIFIFACICLPEWGVLIHNFPKQLHVTMAASSVLFGLSLLTLLYASCYVISIDRTQFTRIAFGIAISEMLLVLFTTPLWSIACINLIIGIITFRRFFYRYENNVSAKAMQ